jgi:hypothetical protein
MDPESGSITARWTAPKAGRFEIAGNFIGIDTFEHLHPVFVTDTSNHILWSANI